MRVPGTSAVAAPFWPPLLLLLSAISSLSCASAAASHRSRAGGHLRAGAAQGFEQGFELGFQLGLREAGGREEGNGTTGAGSGPHGQEPSPAERREGAEAGAKAQESEWGPRTQAFAVGKEPILVDRGTVANDISYYSQQEPILVEEGRVANGTSNGTASSAGEGRRRRGREGTDGVASGWTLHHICGMLVFVAFAGFVCAAIPLLRSEYAFYKENIGDDEDPFSVYLTYKFTDWFTTRRYAPSFVLLTLTMGLIVSGAILYAFMVGTSPSHSLWRIFVWSTGSPAEGEVTPAGRFLGILVTVCGLIILSLLLGIVTDMFTTKMAEIKQGVSKVVEGGHVVILGYTECTRCLLEELANARESEGGGMFVILAQEKKEDVESQLYGNELNILNSRIVVRSGNPCVIRDLHKVAANSAAQVVILSDTSVPPEEADAKSIRTLLALMTKGWPTNGRIIVQCATEANRALFMNIYSGKAVEVVVVGNIVAKLMAQTSRQNGLASVFGMMLGFDGDEFYNAEWPELVGHTFREATFKIPEAVVLGVFTAKGACMLNPGWDYEIQEGDEVIVLAEDNDTYSVAEEPYYSFTESEHQPLTVERNVSVASLRERVPREKVPTKTLIIGWNNNIGPLLLTLDAMVARGSTITIYSPRPVQERETDIAKLEQRFGHKLVAVEITHMCIDEEEASSRIELQRLNHHEHDSIFILAEGATRARADERTMAVLTQLTNIGAQISEEEEKKPFDPVVEMCEDSTAEHLKMCGFDNFVHSNSLVSQALAAVTEEPKVNAIYHDLMSNKNNTFEFRSFKDFLPEGEKEPEMLSFGEAAHRISLAGDIALVAWSAGTPEQREWVMNPKDKVTPRAWTPDDRVVVVRRFVNDDSEGGTAAGGEARRL